MNNNSNSQSYNNSSLSPFSNTNRLNWKTEANGKDTCEAFHSSKFEEYIEDGS